MTRRYQPRGHPTLTAPPGWSPLPSSEDSTTSTFELLPDDPQTRTQADGAASPPSCSHAHRGTGRLEVPAVGTCTTSNQRGSIKSGGQLRVAFSALVSLGLGSPGPQGTTGRCARPSPRRPNAAPPMGQSPSLFRPTRLAAGAPAPLPSVMSVCCLGPPWAGRLRLSGPARRRCVRRDGANAHPPRLPSRFALARQLSSRREGQIRARYANDNLSAAGEMPRQDEVGW